MDRSERKYPPAIAIICNTF
jgi:hypothetical protein